MRLYRKKVKSFPDSSSRPWGCELIEAISLQTYTDIIPSFFFPRSCYHHCRDWTTAVTTHVDFTLFPP